MLDYPLYGDLEREPESGGQAPAVYGTGSDPTHHITLTDILGNSVGFVLTDQAGDLDERSFRRYPISSPANPYVTEKQEAFGGFGQSRWEDNRSMYWWSQGADTTKGPLVLGGRFRYGQGAWRNAAMYQPGDDDDTFRWVEIVMTEAYFANKYTVGSSNWSGSSTYIKLWVKRVGNPGRLRVRIIADNAGDPTGSTLATAYISASDVDPLTPEWYRVAIVQSTPQASTSYWVVVDGVVDYTPTADNHWRVGAGETNTNGKASSDGSSWNAAGFDMFFRLEGPRKDFKPIFYNYKGQMYFVAAFEENDTSQIYQNGWRGACDSNSGNLDTLRDSTQSEWATKITGQETVRLMAGPSAGQENKDWRKVSAGASGILTVSSDWEYVQSGSDDYIVTNTDHFTAIGNNQTSEGSFTLWGDFTDVAVAEGIVYYARGNNKPILIHREYNNGGTWRNGNAVSDDAWKNSHQVQAEFVEVLNDPVSGPQLWFGENPREVGNYQPVVCQSEPVSWDNDAINFQTVITHNGADQVVPWTASTGDVTVSVDHWGVVNIDVLIGKVYVGGCSIADGGADYSNGSGIILTLHQSGSSGTAKLSCTASGGVITSIDSVTVQGHSYVTGTVTTTATGGGSPTSNATITLSGFEGFGTGKLAYANLVDAQGNATSVDLRNMNLLALNLLYNSKDAFAKTSQTLTDGDLTFDLDNTANAVSPYVNLEIPGLAIDHEITADEPLSMDLTDYADAASTSAVSITLANAKTRSFRLSLVGKTYALKDIKPIKVGNLDFDNITNLNTYGDPEALWVMTETGLGEIRNNLYMPLPQRELKIARHPSNGKGCEVSDVYLLFTWRGRLQRYFRQNLEDLGPDFPYELGELEGDIVDIVTYPGRVYVAIDGGSSGRSMVLCHKGGGWHEVFTSFSGERIQALHIQPIAGGEDRLWFGCGSDMMWVPIELNPSELPSSSTFRFRGGGYLTTSWVYTADAELNKLFRSLILTLQRATDSDLNVDVLYQIDDEDADWQVADRSDVKSASAIEHWFGDYSKGDAKAGNRIRVRLVLGSKNSTKSPVVRSIQHRMYRMPEVKFAYTWLTKASSLSINLRGDEERVVGTQSTVQEAIWLMDGWAATTMPLTVSSNISVIKDKLVILEPMPTQLLMIVNDEGIEEQNVQVSVNDA